jgi:transposase-like protein
MTKVKTNYHDIPKEIKEKIYLDWYHNGYSYKYLSEKYGILQHQVSRAVAQGFVKMQEKK